MAQKRNYKKKKNTKSRKKASKLDLAIIILIMLSLLVGALIFTKSGIIGLKLNEVLGGMFGIMQYIIPIGMFAIAIKLACEERETLTAKLIQYGIFIISLSVLFSVIQVSTGELQSSKELSEVVKDAYYLGSQSKGGGAIGAVGAVTGELQSSKELSEVVKDAYYLGSQSKGGGAIGAVGAVPLAKLLGDVGAVILCIGIAVVLLVFTFGINMSDIINMFMERLEEKKEENREARIERKRHNEDDKETVAERRKREKEERLARREQEKAEKMEKEKNMMDNQIKINFGGRILEEPEHKGLKKYDHSQDNIVPLTKETKKDFIQPDVIENNLFKQEEEKKEDKKKEVLQLEHAMVVEDEHYEYPPVELLSKAKSKTLKGGAKALTDTATKLQKTLYSFGVSAKVENVSVGPAITRYELKPAEGVRVSKIANLADDIALNLAAETIRIEAPIPGKQAVGIEVPNKEKETVHLREVLESSEFRNNSSKLTVALGKDVAGNTQLADIAKMPHMQ